MSRSAPSMHLLPVGASSRKQARRRPKQSPCSLRLPLGRCYLGQASQPLDDAEALLYLLHLLPQTQALAIACLRYLLLSILTVEGSALCSLA